MSLQTKCVNCESVWEWNTDDVFDYTIPVGKRVWPALCPACKQAIEHRYKSKQITHTELLLEFSNISGKIAKRCVVSGSDALLKLKMFKTTRRGK